ncbi:MAG: right-handed parallel beta-helix repeat-containing protein [Planctomycetota bacterium]|nr:right-handed parallel beta-helix repeat-containing protein [Planctomycetota bacterium]
MILIGPSLRPVRRLCEKWVRHRSGAGLTFAIAIFAASFSGCTPASESSPTTNTSPSSLDTDAPESSAQGTSIILPSSESKIRGSAEARLKDESQPLFMGIQQLLPGDGEIIIQWESGVDDHTSSENLRYQVFTATKSGKQDFSTQPQIVTEPGVNFCRVTDLNNGQVIHAVVRCVDESGKADTNENEWAAVPNPVRYVNDSVSDSGTGLQPPSAFKTIDEAIGAAIGMPGVNIYVCEGSYAERFLLFDGMSIFGGFSEDFTTLPDPKKHKTRLLGEPHRDTIILPPGESLVAIDGFSFEGSGTARRAIMADDCVIRISNCEIRNFADKGIQIETDDDDGGEASGSILSCRISENRGDGLRIEGFVDLSIRESHFLNNAQSGISAPSLSTRSGGKTRLDLQRNQISGNGDIGLNIRISGQKKVDSNDPPRVRIGLRGIDCHANGDHGISLDIRYTDENLIDMRTRIESSSIRDNLRSGVHLDVDALGDYSIQGCEILSNRGEAGVFITGDSARPLVRVNDSKLFLQSGNGIRLDGTGMLEVQRCSFGGNKAPAVSLKDNSSSKGLLTDCTILTGPVSENLTIHDSGLTAPKDLGPVAIKILSTEKVSNTERRITSEDSSSQQFPKSGYLLNPTQNSTTLSFVTESTSPLKLLLSGEGELKIGNTYYLSESESLFPSLEALPAWFDIGRLPNSDFLSHQLNSHSHQELFRADQIIGLTPPLGELTPSNSQSWSFELSGSEAKPQVVAQLNGVPVEVSLQVVDELLSVTMNDSDSPSGFLEIIITIPEHQNFPERQFRYTWNLTVKE